MLRTVGVGSLDDLFAHLPPEVRLNRPLEIPAGKSEYEIVDYFRARGGECADGYAWFLGAGVYRHYRPVLVDTVVSRSEFLTSYTPYQAEISQGTLTTIFEFQTMICQLTGMDVANASMYDGSTAVPEAAMMAMRLTGRDRILVARSVHPEYREVLSTYAQHQGMPVAEIGYARETAALDHGDLEKKIDDQTAAVIIQSPNFFGIVEDVRRAAEIAHRHGALLIYVFTEAVSLGLLEPPRDADIVAGELQSFAISPSYGGPFAGIIATKEKFMRQMPGRIVGETKDTRGNRAFCLTLAAREQHIRREKATSNICTNQALIALMATVFMTVYGKQGLRELAQQNLSKAHYLAGKLPLRFSGPFFNEFVVSTEIPRCDQRVAAARKESSAACRLARYYPELENSMLLCATEMSRREEMDAVAEAFAMIKKVRPHVNQNEPLLFERSSPGKRGYQLPPLDVPAVDPASGARRPKHARRNRRFPGSQRSGSHPPLHAPLHVELRHRSRPVPARLLHHEVQPARQRAGSAHRRPGLGASLSARIAVAGNHGSDGDARTDARRNHRHGRGHAAAGRGRARRVHGHPAGPRAAPIARQSPQEASDSGFGARHQSGHRRHGRLCGRKHQVQRPGMVDVERAGAFGGRRCRRADADQSQHARRLRRTTLRASPKSCTPKAPSSTWTAPT